MKAHEALTIVAREWGGIMGKHGEITGWQIPEDERAVRKVPPPRPPPTTVPSSGVPRQDEEKKP